MTSSITGVLPIVTYSTGQTSNDFAQAAQIIHSIPGYKLEVPEALVNPNYIPANRAPALLGIFLSSIGVAIVTVILRLYARLWIKEKRLLLEDYIVIVGMVIGIACTALACYGAIDLQWGYKMTDIQFRSMRITTIIVYVYQILFLWTMTCIRLSLILLIRRLYRQTGSRLIQVSNILIGVLIACAVASTIAMLLQCHQIEAGWDIWKRSESRCDALAVYYANCVLSTTMDAAVLMLPLNLVWTLSTTFRRKVQLFALLGFGCVAWIACIARFWSLHDAVRLYKWESIVNVIICTQLELTITISCASGPALKALYNRLFHTDTSFNMSWIVRTIRPTNRRQVKQTPPEMVETGQMDATLFSANKTTISVIKKDDITINGEDVILGSPASSAKENFSEKMDNESLNDHEQTDKTDVEKGLGLKIIKQIEKPAEALERQISFPDDGKLSPTPRSPGHIDLSILHIMGLHGLPDNTASITDIEDENVSHGIPLDLSVSPIIEQSPTHSLEQQQPVHLAGNHQGTSRESVDEQEMSRPISNESVSEYTWDYASDPVAPLSPRPVVIPELDPRPIEFPPRRFRRLTMVPEEADTDEEDEEVNDYEYDDDEDILSDEESESERDAWRRSFI